MDSEQFQDLIDEKVRGEEGSGKKEEVGEGEDKEGNGIGVQEEKERREGDEGEEQEANEMQIEPGPSSAIANPQPTRQSKRKVGPPKPFPPPPPPMSQKEAMKVIGPIRIKKPRGRQPTNKNTVGNEPGKGVNVNQTGIREAEGTTDLQHQPPPQTLLQNPNRPPPSRLQTTQDQTDQRSNQQLVANHEEGEELANNWQEQVNLWNDTMRQENPRAIRGVGGIVLGERDEGKHK
ncbi:uncharacterized protein MELLADRAFT_93152 [Melampsora larici-populina 98AG31]|uniref:Uncharacterized protein n=1 Tax=Melampsora larici-populina (strain 98AG31 / pathotype 3-4-7) TaxID=747676 RepID=F4S499_MELLP|nr:uncharacterized protein MELLADRAFT_93152 [Melampsora larici-populina 98AG31]EGG00594.1 hypothetical protein MELLADRAFT_93152 [Melampsora larici-populina 98AG31]